MDIFTKSTFSGGRAQLGDVHCFLGVVADMKKLLQAAEVSYRNAIDLYEKCRATDNNPNYTTAMDNLNANIKRQKYIEIHGPPPEAKQPPPPPPQQAPQPKKQPLQRSPVANQVTDARVEKTNLTSPNAKRRPPPPPTRTPNTGRVNGGNIPASPPQPPSRIPNGGRTGSPQPGKQRIGNGLRTPPRPLPKMPKPRAPPGQSPVVNKREANTSPPPTTLKAMTEHATKSMPQSPPPRGSGGPTGTYEEMARRWYADGRKILPAG